MLQNATLLMKSAPSPPNICEEHVYKTHHARTTFGSWDVEKVRAVVARSAFPSQNAQNTPGSEHFWKLRCQKSVPRCGAKHISKSKVLRTDGFGAFLEVELLKKRTPLRREARFEVKMHKTSCEEDLQRCIFAWQAQYKSVGSLTSKLPSIIIW